MKSTRYSEEQIIRILQEVQSGKAVAAVRRQYNVAEATVHRWRSKYRDMDQGSLRRLRELEAELIPCPFSTRGFQRASTTLRLGSSRCSASHSVWTNGEDVEWVLIASTSQKADWVTQYATTYPLG